MTHKEIQNGSIPEATTTQILQKDVQTHRKPQAQTQPSTTDQKRRNPPITCFRPIPAWRAASPNESGKRSLRFTPKGSENPDGEFHISCGQCIGCRLKRAQDWSIRLTHEAQYHDKAIFLTLTFRDSELARRENPGSLDKCELQRFIKRLRKNLFGNRKGNLRYYAVGEYGEKTGRPHYHLLLFGYWPDDAQVHSSSPKGNQLYVSDTLQRLWPYGFCPFGKVTWDSATYCAGYVCKKYTNDSESLSWIDPIDGKPKPKIPEFSLMSRKPAIGTQWIQEHWKDALHDDYVVIKGKKRALPRFYDDWLTERYPEEMQINDERRLEEYRKSPEITEDRRIDMHMARWKHHTSRLKEPENHGTDDIHDLRQQSEGIPKAILHAKQRYSYKDVEGNDHT